MKVEIPKNISIRKQIIEALMTHILVMKETEFILENEEKNRAKT